MPSSSAAAIYSTSSHGNGRRKGSSGPSGGIKRSASRRSSKSSAASTHSSVRSSSSPSLRYSQSASLSSSSSSSSSSSLSSSTYHASSPSSSSNKSKRSQHNVNASHSSRSDAASKKRQRAKRPAMRTGLDALFDELRSALSESRVVNVRRLGYGRRDSESAPPLTIPPFAAAGWSEEVKESNRRVSASHGGDVALDFMSRSIASRRERETGDTEVPAFNEENEIMADANEQLKQLEKQHSIYTARIDEHVDYLKKTRQSALATLDARVASLLLQDVAYRRKQRLQLSTAKRRLQELLFECMGEVSKACSRATLLASGLCTHVRAEKAHANKSTEWKEFLLRAEEDNLGSYTFRDVQENAKSKKSENEFNALCAQTMDAAESAKLIPEGASIRVHRISAMYLTQSSPEYDSGSSGRRRRRDGRRRVTKIQSSAEGVLQLLSKLSSEYGVKEGTNGSTPSDLRHYPKQVSICPRYSATIHLTSKCIQWLMPADQQLGMDSRIYYCIEDRMLQRLESEVSNSMLAVGMSQSELQAASSRVKEASAARVAAATALFLESVHVKDSGAILSPEKLESMKSLMAKYRGDKDGTRYSLVVRRCDAKHRMEAHNAAAEMLSRGSIAPASQEEINMLQNVISSYPDVLVAQVFAKKSVPVRRSQDDDEESSNNSEKEHGSQLLGVLHFASAHVLQVIESVQFQHHESNISPDDAEKIQVTYPSQVICRGGVSSFAVLGPSKQKSSGSAFGDTRVGASIEKLSVTASAEICNLYGARASCRDVPDSMTVFQRAASHIPLDFAAATSSSKDNRASSKQPLQARKLQYFVLHNPSVAFLYLSREKDGETSQSLTDMYGGIVEKERILQARENREAREAKRNGEVTPSRSSSTTDAGGLPNGPTALLVGVEVLENNDEGVIKDEAEKSSKEVSASSKKKGVLQGMSGLAIGKFCRWRGCNCPGSKAHQSSFGNSNSKPAVLCPLHTSLKVFLETSGSKDELSRHMPSLKKAKSILEKKKNRLSPVGLEFLRITATSALLQELAGGKLAATIRAFCRRAAADAKARKDKSSSSSSGKGAKRGKADKIQQKSPRASSSVAIAAAEKRRRELMRDIALSQRVFGTEKAVADELRKLCSLGVFPTEELRAIRGEYDSLNRERMRIHEDAASADQQRRGKRRGKSQSSPGPQMEVEEDEDEYSEERSRERDARARVSGERRAKRTDGDLEFEFCTRKLSILRKRREKLERALSQGAAAAAISLGTSSSNPVPPTAKSGADLSTRHKSSGAKAGKRLEEARRFATKNSAGAPSPYLMPARKAR